MEEAEVLVAEMTYRLPLAQVDRPYLVQAVEVAEVVVLELATVPLVEHGDRIP